MLSTCTKQPFLPHRPDKTIQEDLLWWLQKIITGAVIRPITTPITPLDPHAFSDASSGLGIGIVIGSRWRAWRLQADWNTYRGKKDIGWAKAVGFELLIRATDAILDQPTDLILHGDNTGVLDGWRFGRHCNHAVNAVFKSIHTFLKSASHTLSIQPRYVTSADNPADPPSRGIYSPPHLLLPSMDIPEYAWDLLTDSTDPLSARELRELQEGRYSTIATQTLDKVCAQQQEAEHSRAEAQLKDELIVHILQDD